MKRLKIYALKKGETHNIFYLEKNKLFLDKFTGFLVKLGFEKYFTNMELLSLLGELENNYSERKYSKKLYEDKYFYFENKCYKIDLFFGKEKIILSIFTSSDKQNEIMKLIEEFCDFYE